MNQIPGPEDAAARLAIYIGAPIGAVAFFATLWKVMSWVKVLLGTVHGTQIALERLRTLTPRKPGTALQSCGAQALYVLAGTYLAQCFQFVAGVPSASGQENNADSTSLAPGEFLAMMTFEPFKFTPSVIAILLVVSGLFTADLVFGRSMTLVPWTATLLASVPAALLTMLGLFPAVLGVIAGLLGALTGGPTEWPSVVTYFAVGLAFAPWYGAAVWWMHLGIVLDRKRR